MPVCLVSPQITQITQITQIRRTEWIPAQSRKDAATYTPVLNQRSSNWKTRHSGPRSLRTSMCSRDIRTSIFTIRGPSALEICVSEFVGCVTFYATYVFEQCTSPQHTAPCKTQYALAPNLCNLCNLWGIALSLSSRISSQETTR